MSELIARLRKPMNRDEFFKVADGLCREAADEIERLTAAPAPGPQCCMCGNKNLSTVEGDGGDECELTDGRWVCSAECWDKAVAAPAPGVKLFKLGDMVRKRSGSWWEGRVVGFYSTEQTPDGVCVQLDKPMGPVQIYPASALAALSMEEGAPAPGKHMRGEPTGYLVKRYDLNGVLLHTELSFKKPAILSTCKTEFVPLYAALATTEGKDNG